MIQSIAETYTEMRRQLSEADDPRFIIFAPRDESGWGNRLRGLTLCFLFSLCTRRILVVDDFLIQEHFLSPDGTDWSSRKWKSHINRKSGVRIMALHIRPDNFSEREWKEFQTVPMNSLFPEKVIILSESIGFIDALMTNPHHEPFFRRCGLETTSKLSWMASITQFLLSRPSPKMSRAIGRFSRRIGWRASPDLGVQFRSFLDIGSPYAVYVDSFLSEVTEEAKRQFAGKSERSIYIITDDPEITKRLCKGLIGLGNIICWPRRMVHTGGMNLGIMKYVERILAKIFGTRAQGFDFFFWLPRGRRPRPHSAVLAEWFLLGECKQIYSTFSSFAVFAAARCGNSARLMKYDPSRRKLEQLRNDTYYY